MLFLERWGKTRRARQFYESLNEHHEESAPELDPKHSQGNCSDLQACLQDESRTKWPLVYTLVGLSAVTLLLLLPLVWMRRETMSPERYPMPDRS